MALTDQQRETLRQIARMDQALQLVMDVRHRLRDIAYVARLHGRDDLARQAREAKREAHELGRLIVEERNDLESLP